MITMYRCVPPISYIQVGPEPKNDPTASFNIGAALLVPALLCLTFGCLNRDIYAHVYIHSKIKSLLCLPFVYLALVLNGSCFSGINAWDSQFSQHIIAVAKAKSKKYCVQLHQNRTVFLLGQKKFEHKKKGTRRAITIWAEWVFSFLIILSLTTK